MTLVLISPEPNKAQRSAWEAVKLQYTRAQKDLWGWIHKASQTITEDLSQSLIESKPLWQMQWQV